MLSTPEMFLKSFLWKRVDISINKAEYQYIFKEALRREEWVKLFSRFEHMVIDKKIFDAYIIVLSNLKKETLHKFLRYFLIHYASYRKREYSDTLSYLEESSHTKDHETTIQDSFNAYIGNDDDRFRIFLICMQFYF